MNWNYINGFFDADGSVTLSRQTRKSLKTPQLSFHNNEISILEDMQSFIYDKIKVKGFISKKNPKKENHNTAYDLKYTNFPKVIKLIQNMNSNHPKKKHRFNTIIEMYKYVKRNGKYTKEILNKRNEYEQKFFSMK